MTSILAQASTNAPTATKSPPWAMLAVLLLGQFMALLDVTIVNVAVPTIGTDLHASGASLQLVVAGYTVAYATLLITGARLGDIFGRRRMYLIGVIGFTLGSLACGLAPQNGVLISARVVQGAAAAVMVPQIMSVIQMQFSGAARATALSAYGAVLSIGAVAGLILGGILVDADLLGLSWRPVFLVNVPLGLILVALVPRLVPADRPQVTRRLDLAGLFLAAPAVVLLVVPLVLGRTLDWPRWAFVCIAAAVVVATMFVLLERRMAARGGDPLLNLNVLRAPGMAAGLTTLLCMQLAYGGFLFMLTIHLQRGLGDTPLRAGLTYIPMAGVFGVVGFSWRKLPASLHPMLPPAGLAFCAFAYLAIAIALRDGTQASPVFWAGLVLSGIGMGLSVSPLVTQSLVHVPLSKAADASGLFTTTMQLGQVVGVATFGSLFLAMAGSFAAGTGADASAEAISNTCGWLAALAVVGVASGLFLARTSIQAQRLVRGNESTGIAPSASKGVPSP